MRHGACYSDRFRRTVRLADGSCATLRLVRPEDRELFRRGFEQLSPESRYRRFLMHRDRLSDRELTYLTDLDGWDHLAIGATGGREGIGVARFIRLADDPGAADAAVVVLDAFHGRGLGRALLMHLAEAARERDVLRFRCDILVDNAPMRALLRSLSTGVQERVAGGGVLQVDVPLA